MLLQSLAHYRRAGVRHGVEECFELLGGIARRRGLMERAAWCWGVVEQLEKEMGKLLSKALLARRAQDWQILQSAIPNALFSAARAEGLQVPLEAAFAAVLPGGASR